MPLERLEFPIMGKVTTVSVQQGANVSEGDTICLIESMKMENPIVSPVTGKVVEIQLAVGQVVQSGQLVCVIEYQ